MSIVAALGLVFVSSSFVSSPSSALAAPRARPLTLLMAFEVKRVRLAPDVIEALDETLATKLIEQRRTRLVPRWRARAALGRARARRCASGCARKIAQKLGAARLITARITRLGGACRLSLRVYRVDRAPAARAVQTAGPCSEAGLLRSVLSAVGKLGARRPSKTARKQKVPGFDVGRDQQPSPPPEWWGRGKRRHRERGTARAKAVRAFLHNEYTRALKQGLIALRASPRDQTLLAITGASACKLKRVRTAQRLYARLRPARKAMMRRVCLSIDIKLK